MPGSQTLNAIRGKFRGEKSSSPPVNVTSWRIISFPGPRAGYRFANKRSYVNGERNWLLAWQ